MKEHSRDAQAEPPLRMFLRGGRATWRLGNDADDSAQGKVRAAVHVTFGGLLPAVRAMSRTGGDYSFPGGLQCRPA
jgi:hypothetical protein